MVRWNWARHLEPQVRRSPLEVRIDGRFDSKRGLRDGVFEAKRRAVQQKAVDADRVAEVTIVRALAVAHVADDGVRDVSQVAADLMAPAVHGTHFEQRVASRGVSIDGEGHLTAGDALETGDGRAHRAVVIGDWVVDLARIVGPAANDGQVCLVDAAIREGVAEGGDHRSRQREEQYARGRPIEAVGRVHPLPNLVAQHLNRDAIDTTVERGAVHEEPRGFVDRDQIVVAVEDSERQGISSTANGATSVATRYRGSAPPSRAGGSKLSR